jgi:hypothetical protein
MDENMRSRLMLAILGVASALSACSSSHGTGRDAATSGRDAGMPSILDASTGDAGPLAVDGGMTPPRHDGSIPEPPADVTVCGGATCAAGEECCLATLECFDPADPSACALPSGTTDPDACVSNADCGPDELCEHRDIFAPAGEPAAACGGLVGHCVMVRGPELCGGFGDGVCGCDGRTYADPCAASRAGVRVSWLVPCGESRSYTTRVDCDAEHPFCGEGWHCDLEAGQCAEDRPLIACGIDEQCPEGWSCCGFVGACMPTDCPECCFVPPPGTRYPCRVNDDCAVLSEDAADRVDDWLCDGDGCGTPGGCRRRERSCGGELEPVCGCDGTSYANACWASAAGTRVAHAGECP